MIKKIVAFALPLGLMPLLLGASSSHAATPTATVGVTATVLTGCKVSAATLNGSYAAAIEHATSSVTINCTDNTQYSIAVIADLAVNSAVTIGKFSFPVQSLLNYAMSAVSARSYSRSITSGVGNSLPKPQVAYTESSNASGLSSSAPPGTIAIAITY